MVNGETWNRRVKYLSRNPRTGCVKVSGVRFPRRSAVFTSHAKNKIAGQIIPFLVPGLWDKNTMICAGTMPYHRDFLATTRI